ncbi:MAG: hypothetical protein V7K68_00805 [Nostoc sp.]|uniref:hypothetical protein n=1 Tax=Nostoc sp. TaxID=1180 RepID=UPI002FF8B385
MRHSGQEDHQTEVLRQELIDGYGLLPQQILREAIADYHAKIKSQEKEQPQEVLALTTAREAGLIIDYYELENGWLQVFIAGEDKPVSISKSNVISWVQEQERLNCVTT